MPDKLRYFRSWPTERIVASFAEGSERLFVRDDGLVMNGHHRLVVLLERGIDINALPRTPYTRVTYGDE